MLDDMLRADRLTAVIDHAIAPAFLMGAIAAFLAIMLTRVERLVGQLRAATGGHGGSKGADRDRLQLEQRVKLLKLAVFYALCSAIAVTVLVIVSFLLGFLNFTHVYGMGFLFLVSVSLLTCSLGLFAREIRISIGNRDQTD